MGFKLNITTPHGIALENAYCNIDFFSFTKRSEGLIFNMVFYRDKEAFDEGLPALPDMIIADNIPLNRIDISKNIRDEIYMYAKDQARVASGDGEFLAEYQERIGEILVLDQQYSLLIGAEDVFEEAPSGESAPVEETVPDEATPEE